MPEVIYVKGFPDDIETPWACEEPKWECSPQFLSANKLPDRKTVMDFNTWSYNLDNSRIDVDFDAHSKQIIRIACFSSAPWHCPPILGIQDGMSEDEVKNKLGKATSEHFSGPGKVLVYAKLNVRLNLVKTKLYFIEILSNINSK